MTNSRLISSSHTKPQHSTHSLVVQFGGIGRLQFTDKQLHQFNSFGLRLRVKFPVKVLATCVEIQCCVENLWCCDVQGHGQPGVVSVGAGARWHAQDGGSECGVLGCWRCWHGKGSAGSHRVSPLYESACVV